MSVILGTLLSNTTADKMAAFILKATVKSKPIASTYNTSYLYFPMMKTVKIFA